MLDRRAQLAVLMRDHAEQMFGLATNASADDYTVFWGEDALVKSSEV